MADGVESEKIIGIIILAQKKKMRNKNIALAAAALALLLISVPIVVAQQTQATKLVGQVVCGTCWFEATDRKVTRYGTAADLKCALDCADNGLPQALAVEDEKGFTLYTLEKGAYKGTSKDFLDFVPKTVEIEGVVRSDKGKNFIKVDAIKAQKDSPAKPKPVSDEAALSLKDLFGADVNLTQYKGRFIVLNFWATWCEPCKKEMPDLSAIQNDYAALGLQVIGASGDAVTDSAKVLKFSREFRVSFPVWLGATPADMDRLGVGQVLPATVIIDREGKIVWREIGVIKPVVVRKELDR